MPMMPSMPMPSSTKPKALRKSGNSSIQPPPTPTTNNTGKNNVKRNGTFPQPPRGNMVAQQPSQPVTS